jgi:hypothetical protein
MASTHNAARVDQVLELVVAGLTRAHIIKWVQEKSDWKIGDRQTDRLIHAARQILQTQAEPHRREELAKSLRRLDMLFARSLQINDFKGCLAIERERIALLHLSAAVAANPPKPKAAQTPAARLKTLTLHPGHPVAS